MLFLFAINSSALAFQNEPGGFRGIEWREPLSKYRKEMGGEDVNVGNKKTIWHHRETDTLTMGPAVLDNIVYGFDDDGLNRVEIYPGTDLENLRVFYVFCQKFWGQPHLLKTGTSYIYAWWLGEKTSINYQYNSAEDTCVLTIQAMPQKWQETLANASPAVEADGFMGMKWGEPYEKYKDQLTLLDTIGKSTYYTREGKPAYVGPFLMKEVKYVFNKDILKFMGISAVVERTHEKEAQILQYCIDQWGKEKTGKEDFFRWETSDLAIICTGVNYPDSSVDYINLSVVHIPTFLLNSSVTPSSPTTESPVLGILTNIGVKATLRWAAIAFVALVIALLRRRKP